MADANSEVKSARVGGASITDATYISTAIAAMVATTAAVTALAIGTASDSDKTDETQEVIILSSPMANLVKEIYNTPIH